MTGNSEGSLIYSHNSITYYNNETTDSGRRENPPAFFVQKGDEKNERD